MNIKIRKLKSEEIENYIKVMFWAAGRDVNQNFIQEMVKTIDIENALAAFDGKDLVGTIGTRNLNMTLPGLNKLPFSAIGQGGVLPTHTRNGIMKKMMLESMKLSKDKGNSFAGWTTSEWPIYERYGGGVSSFSATYRIKRQERNMLKYHESDSSNHMINSDQALELLPTLHKKSTNKPGGVARGERYWSRIINSLQNGKSLDHLESKIDYPKALYCVNKKGGEPKGICIYRVHQKWVGGNPESKLEVINLLSKDIDSEFSLWKQLLNTDLVKEIFITHGELNHPLRFLLKDGRKLDTVSITDHIWLRVFEPKQMLENRYFPKLEKPLRFKIYDPLGFVGNETFEVYSDGKMTEVRKSKAEVSITFEVGRFASLVLGGISVWDLVNSGQLKFDNQKTAESFNFAFNSSRRPFTDNSF